MQYAAWEKATGTGRMVDLLNPTPETIDLEDIITSLEAIPRWNGTTGHHFSVASHSLLVGREYVARYPDAKGWELAGALLHDAHEAYTGDISTPMKNSLRTLGGETIHVIEQRLDAAICTRLGLWGYESRYENIKEADRAACIKEAWALFDVDFDPEWRGTPPNPIPREEDIRVVPEAQAGTVLHGAILWFTQTDYRDKPVGDWFDRMLRGNA